MRTEAQQTGGRGELPPIPCKSLTWPADQFTHHDPAHKMCRMLEVLFGGLERPESFAERQETSHIIFQNKERT